MYTTNGQCATFLCDADGYYLTQLFKHHKANKNRKAASAQLASVLVVTRPATTQYQMRYASAEYYIIAYVCMMQACSQLMS